MTAVEPGDPVPDEDQPEQGSGPLAEPVRLRVLALAAEALGALKPEEVPAQLRPFARFTPVKRARLAATSLAAVLEADPLFRQRVSERVRAAMPALVDAVTAGHALPAAPPADIAAVAYLLRPAGWRERISAATLAVERERVTSVAAEQADEVRRRDEQLAAARGAARAANERLRAELDRFRHDNEELRRRLGEARERGRRAETTLTQREQEASERAAQEATATAAAEAEARRLRARLGEVESALAAARRTGREARSLDDARVWLLLDTVAAAAQGLRRELALPPPTTRPGDLVTGAADAAEPFAGVGIRGLADDDPAVLDQLLAIPGVHLVVDGYNVTMAGYGELPLETQRGRLLSGLAALAAQTASEVTCVFDGAVREGPVAAPAPRGVRLLFSPPGQTADELIRRLVAAEPSGRPVVVVSSDREVADGVRRIGARAVASAALLRRLART